MRCLGAKAPQGSPAQREADFRVAANRILRTLDADYSHSRRRLFSRNDHATAHTDATQARTEPSPHAAQACHGARGALSPRVDRRHGVLAAHAALPAAGRLPRPVRRDARRAEPHPSLHRARHLDDAVQPRLVDLRCLAGRRQPRHRLPWRQWPRPQARAAAVVRRRGGLVPAGGRRRGPEPPRPLARGRRPRQADAEHRDRARHAAERARDARAGARAARVGRHARQPVRQLARRLPLRAVRPARAVLLGGGALCRRPRPRPLPAARHAPAAASGRRLVQRRHRLRRHHRLLLRHKLQVARRRLLSRRATSAAARAQAAESQPRRVRGGLQRRGRAAAGAATLLRLPNALRLRTTPPRPRSAPETARSTPADQLDLSIPSSSADDSL